ncbi:MAG: response regulator [Elusimicrobia bacterium]|nr:response regulator [Elusimicrobiota bacterium]
MARLRILAADDDEGWRLLIKCWMDTAGHDVLICDNGKAVMAAARGFRPDCFLLDHDMGSTTGHEVCRQIRASAEFKAIPVIIMTANTGIMPKVAADGPPDHFVAKTENPDELMLILDDIAPRNQ